MKIPGADLMVFIKVGGKLISVALATSHTLDVSMNTVDTSTKDNGAGRWQDNEAGLRSWSVTTDNLVSDGGDDGADVNDLMDLLLTGEKVELAFGLQGNKDSAEKEENGFEVPEGGWTPDTANHYKGTALVTNLSVNANNGERASFSATFTGCGALSKVGKGIVGKAASTIAAATQIPVATPSAKTAAK